jgi:hypothetical protein
MIFTPTDFGSIGEHVFLIGYYLIGETGGRVPVIGCNVTLTPLPYLGAKY